MLVHFIGGPVHGESKAIRNPSSIYRVPELRRVFAVVENQGFPTIDDSSFTEHQYRITKRTPRYAIAEWEAPTIQVRFVVDLEVDPFDREASEALRRFIMERRVEERDGVKCVAAEAYSAEKTTITLATLVEGPEDPIAIHIAAEKIQHYLDAHLPPSKQLIRHTAAETA